MARQMTTSLNTKEKLMYKALLLSPEPEIRKVWRDNDTYDLVGTKKSTFRGVKISFQRRVRKGLKNSKKGEENGRNQ